MATVTKIRPVETNPSGINPTEYKVLVKPAQVEKKIGSIIIPEQHLERKEFAQVEGTLIAVSPAAFNYDGMARDVAPQPGDRVLYAKYSGLEVKGKDGEDYKIVNDRDICAILD